jgi:hypothetical protein
MIFQPRLSFEHLGHDLAEIAQPRAAAFGARARRGFDDPFDRQIVWQLARPTQRAGTLFLGRLQGRQNGDYIAKNEMLRKSGYQIRGRLGNVG